MKRFAVLTLVIACLSIAAAASAEKPWYSIDPTEEYVADFTLKPGAERKVTVGATGVARVMFRVDVNEVPMDQLKKGPFPIAMTDLASKRTITAFWGGIECTAVDGKATISLRNTGKRAHKILVVKLIH
jgi:hypothetical protein